MASVSSVSDYNKLHVFSEVSATIADSFLNIIPNHHRDPFFQKLTLESGVSCEGKENMDMYVLKGGFDQVLLAKIKLEKFIVDLQMGFFSEQFAARDVATTNHSTLKSPQNGVDCSPLQQTNSSSLPLKRAEPPAIFKKSPTKSRRKVGKPRKLGWNINSAFIDTTGSQKTPSPQIGISLIKSSDSKNAHNESLCTSEGEVTENDKESSDDMHSMSVNGSLEEEAERKATEWLSVKLEPQEFNSLDDQIDFQNDASPSFGQPAFEYCCELCSYKADREGQFLKHVLIHGKRDTVHKCDKCDFASVSLNHYNRHKLSHSSSVFKCPQCPYQTDEAKQLARHVTVKHTMANNPPKSSSILQCNECPYNTTKIYHFERHLLVHNRDLKGLLQVYHCEQCPYKTHRKEHFLRHRDNVHIRHRPYQCNMCNRNYKREDALNQHQITVHNIKFLKLSGGSLDTLIDTVSNGDSAIIPEANSPTDMWMPQKD